MHQQCLSIAINVLLVLWNMPLGICFSIHSSNSLCVSNWFLIFLSVVGLECSGPRFVCFLNYRPAVMDRWGNTCLFSAVGLAAICITRSQMCVCVCVCVYELHFLYNNRETGHLPFLNYGLMIIYNFKNKLSIKTNCPRLVRGIL